LKTRPKQILGSLLIAYVLPDELQALLATAFSEQFFNTKVGKLFAIFSIPVSGIAAGLKPLTLG
jgi:hypothetical protein